jgi:hypothetical protein
MKAKGATNQFNHPRKGIKAITIKKRLTSDMKNPIRAKGHLRMFFRDG